MSILFINTYFSSPADCAAQCKGKSGQCGAWTWTPDTCELKKSSRPGDKTPLSGAVSGNNKPCNSSTRVKTIKCQYVDNSKVIQIMCFTLANGNFCISGS